MSVRPAADPDVAGIVLVEHACFPDPWGVDSIRGELAEPTRVPLVAERDGQVVAWAVALVSGDVADLLRIGVLPAARRTGVAGELLTAVTIASATRGAERMLLEVAEDNAAARAFYAGAGFAEIHRRRDYYSGGSDALVLARDLA